MLITYREHVEILDFMYISLLRTKDIFMEFTFALQPNKVNMYEVNLFVANKKRYKLYNYRWKYHLHFVNEL